MSNEKFTAAPIIKDIVMSVLRDHPGQAYSLKELREIVYHETGREFSSGSYSGAMRDLLEESGGRIQNVERGIYVYPTDFKIMQLFMALRTFEEELEEIATDNILRLTEEDIQVIRTIPYLKRDIRKMYKKYNIESEYFQT